MGGGGAGDMAIIGGGGEGDQDSSLYQVYSADNDYEVLKKTKQTTEKTLSNTAFS